MGVRFKKWATYFYCLLAVALLYNTETRENIRLTLLNFDILYMTSANLDSAMKMMTAERKWWKVSQRSNLFQMKDRSCQCYYQSLSSNLPKHTCAHTHAQQTHMHAHTHTHTSCHVPHSLPSSSSSILSILWATPSAVRQRPTLQHIAAYCVYTLRCTDTHHKHTNIGMF